LAAEAYGVDTQRKNIEIAVWNRRLAHEAGAFAARDVELPPLPTGRSEVAQRAREGFALLIGLRWADHSERPVAFSIRFCAAWCNLSRAEAHEAIRELRVCGVIVEVDRRGKLPLFMPGDTDGPEGTKFASSPPTDLSIPPASEDEEAEIRRLLAKFGDMTPDDATSA
jgi:hypothetical protein